MKQNSKTLLLPIHLNVLLRSAHQRDTSVLLRFCRTRLDILFRRLGDWESLLFLIVASSKCHSHIPSIFSKADSLFTRIQKLSNRTRFTFEPTLLVFVRAEIEPKDDTPVHERSVSILDPFANTSERNPPLLNSNLQGRIPFPPKKSSRTSKAGPPPNTTHHHNPFLVKECKGLRPYPTSNGHLPLNASNNKTPNCQISIFSSKFASSSSSWNSRTSGGA